MKQYTACLTFSYPKSVMMKSHTGQEKVNFKMVVGIWIQMKITKKLHIYVQKKMNYSKLMMFIQGGLLSLYHI